MSNVPGQTAPPVVRIRYSDIVEPPKDVAVTRAVISGFRSLATILEPEDPAESEGWVALCRTCETLVKYGDEDEVLAALDMDTLLGTFR
jgi:hypothetical protein